jgi:hypothetical protein
VTDRGEFGGRASHDQSPIPVGRADQEVKLQYNRSSGKSIGMSKTRSKSKSRALVKRAAAPRVPAASFDEVLALIQTARVQTAAVNTALIDLYWSIGEHISRKVAHDGWGQGTVTALAEYIRRRLPNARGFSASNLWRMTQFFRDLSLSTKPKMAPSSLSAAHHIYKSKYAVKCCQQII